MGFFDLFKKDKTKFSEEEFFELVQNNGGEKLFDLASMFKERPAYANFYKEASALMDSDKPDLELTVNSLLSEDDPSIRAYAFCMVLGYIFNGINCSTKIYDEGLSLFIKTAPTVVRAISESYKECSKELFYGALFQAYLNINAQTKQPLTTNRFILDVRKKYYYQHFYWFKKTPSLSMFITDSLAGIFRAFSDRDLVENMVQQKISDYQRILGRYENVLRVVAGQ